MIKVGKRKIVKDQKKENHRAKTPRSQRETKLYSKIKFWKAKKKKKEP